MTGSSLGGTALLFLCTLVPAALGTPTENSCSPETAAAIDQLLEKAPALEVGRIGFEVSDAATGEVLCSRDAQEFLTPASNTKLYTTAFALGTLGPDYRFTTRIQTPGLWQPGVKTIGDLQLIGGGDPD